MADVAGGARLSATRVLLSASDAGAAHHIVHLARLLRDRAEYRTTLYAAPVAGRIFEQNGVPFAPFPALPDARQRPTKRELEALMAAAKAIVQNDPPDLLIGGLSNAGHGPDEALGAAVREICPDCVTATLLDDRGPLHTEDGHHADHLLATSKAIEKWALNAGHSTVHLTGSLKHHALSQLPADRIRRQARDEMGLKDDTRLVTFIAQSDAMEGHNERFRDLAVILDRRKSALPPFELLVRVHPGAPQTGDWCYEEAKRLRLPVRRDSDGEMTRILAASDALFSCSSTSMTDYVWLSMGGVTLNAVPVYLLGKSLEEWLIKLQGTWRPELVARGLAVAATEDDDLEDIALRAINNQLHAPKERRNDLRDIADPFQRTLDIIAEMMASTQMKVRQSKNV